jgi:hypothetical protein
MGIAVVLIIYAVALSIAACIGSVVLTGITSFLTRHSGPRRKFAIIASALFPFICVVYAGGWFIGYAVINSTIFHRDPGLGDSRETPLPNGYALMMIDVTDVGIVYNPKTQPYNDGVISRDDAVFGVRQLQVSNELIFGASDSGYSGQTGRDSDFVDTYFELNTTKKTHAEFQSLDELRRRATSEGVVLHLRPFASVFSDYRYTWFDYFAGVMLLSLPAVGFLLLAWWIWRIRRYNPGLPVDLART